ncbi:YbjN domain-containing protein [Lyngbya confervoides]|uniref:YbjN domain-containing protein n=1 Tax=Lyngbya confervoides BDU141951 TaxID=1574623 RepID=A0ABD4T292_9CYAN|nr:YbjN domain-containing protein [Lyngbya confervoides]MCM1982465.1 YbjN domain-containing protein [Lyngbya confervoides BDU141951]
MSNLTNETVLSKDGTVINPDLNLIEVIETVISSLDEFHNAFVNQTDEGRLWKFTYGSVEAWVQITGVAEGDTFSVWSPILQLPVQHQDRLLEKLMRMNWLETLEARFALFQSQIVVVSSRSISDLDVGEISRLITLVASLADEHDEILQQEFSSVQPS